MFRPRNIAALAIIALSAGASAASAAPAWPTSVVGAWNGMSNQTAIVLTISSQGTTGKCKSISGSIQNVVAGDVTAVTGYYCPNSGNLEFLRYPTSSNVAFQVYNGNLNQAGAGAPQLMMAGSFGQYQQAYGPLGQYSFSLFH